MGRGFEGEGREGVGLFGPLGYAEGVGDDFAGGEDDGWDGVGFAAGWGGGWWGGAERCEV